MSSLVIVSTSSEVDTKIQMEEELRMTRKDLETTKYALKIQAARCRHLVTAFTRKLAEKDAQLKSHRQQREKELSGLLRALLVLEARLRREQKSIKELLAERDNLINDQKLEIERLESEAKKLVEQTPMEIVVETTDIVRDDHAPVESPRGGGTYAKPDLITSLGLPDGSKSEGPDSLSSESTRSCSDEHYFTVVTSPQNRGVLNVHDRSAFSPINKTKSTLDVSPKDDLNKPRNLLQEVRIGSRPDKYHDNPVLQCVNQILLKDQEDFLEEQRNLRSKDGDGAIKTYGWLDEEDSPLDSDLQDDAVQTPSPEDEKVKCNDKEKHVRLNPPLPPKPKVASPKKVEFGDFKGNVQFHNPPMVLPPPQAIDQAQLNIQLSILEPIDQGQDKDLYVISNSALDDDIVKQLRGRTLNVSGLQIKSQRITADRNQHSNVPSGLLHPNHKPHTKPHNESSSFQTNELFSPPRNGHHVNSVLKVNIQESPKPAPSFPFKSPPKVGMPNMIKVASPVATLLTSAGGAQDTHAPSVSQIVRRFEDLGTKKSDEDDESLATKDDSADPSPSGDVPTSPSSVSYDNFLEATGLSQKSIMTPSRMMTNHRNVTKPKDVKLRSRVRSSGVIERCIPPQVVGPTVKYWTEPFL